MVFTGKSYFISQLKKKIELTEREFTSDRTHKFSLGRRREECFLRKRKKKKKGKFFFNHRKNIFVADLLINNL